VAAEHRKHGIGRLLIQTLLTLLEEKQYFSATARVAADLDANGFWQSLKFEIVATKSGGATRGRTINVRARQFNSPSLFGYGGQTQWTMVDRSRTSFTAGPTLRRFQKWTAGYVMPGPRSIAEA
jgi:hypothetical protein